MKDEPSEFRQYDLSGTWKEYKGEMDLLKYIKCLEYESDRLEIQLHKLTFHVSHPYNERYLILRSTIRDLKLLYNQQTKSETFKKLKDEARYVHTFWREIIK